MAEEPPNIVLVKLDEIRKEQALTNAKIGTLAEGMVSMRKRTDDLGKQIDDLRKDMHGLREDVNGLRADVRMIAIAVDEHTHRLDRIEARLNIHDAE
jgi:chromosome segregation ATPase